MRKVGFLSVMALLAALSALAADLSENVLYSNDFETEKAATGFTAVRGEGRGGSTAWVADAGASNASWQVQVRWPIKGVKSGMTFTAEFWFKATTNAAHYAAGPYPTMDVIWDGPGYSQDVSEKERWLAHVRRGTVDTYETDAEGWRKMVVDVTTPIEGDVLRGPTLCIGMRWEKTLCKGGKVWFDDVVVRETGRVWTGEIGCDAYRDEAADGQVTFAAAHFLDAAALKSRGYEARFVSKNAKGETVERWSDCLAVDSARVTYDVTDFPMGSSEVVFVIRDAKTKAELGRSARTFTRVAAERKRRVKLDRFGRTWVDGKLFFPIGSFTWTGAVKKGDVLDRYAASGAFNCIQDYETKMTPELLDFYAQKGLMVVASVKDHMTRAPGCFPPKGLETDADADRYSREVVGACKDHPALLAWMSCDEQPARRKPQLTAKYELMKEIDPDHPVFVCVCDGNSMRAFLNACDVFGTDRYPVTKEPRDLGAAEKTGEMLSAAKKAAFGLRGMWQVPQVYNYRWDRKRESWKTTAKDYRLPTFRELRSMVWQQIALGSYGVLFYAIGSLAHIEYGTIDFEEHFNEMVGVAKEVKRVQDILLREPGPELEVKEPSKLRVRTWKGDADDELYVLVSNPRHEEYKGELPLPPGKWRIERAFIPSLGVKSAGDRLTLDLPHWEIALLKLRTTKRVPVVERRGTLAVSLVESNPVVWRGKPYLYEFNRWSDGRFRSLTGDVNELGVKMAKNMTMSCAFVEGDHLAVTGTRKEKDGTHSVYLTESDDLVTWTEPRAIATGLGRIAYNTTMCKAGARYVLAVERAPTKEEKTTNGGYQMTFLESTDLKTWKTVPDTTFVDNSGSPCLKFHNGWFYFFHLFAYRHNAEGRPIYSMRVARSRDLKKWAIAPRPVLDPLPIDRRPYPGVRFSDKELVKMASAECRNASDIDMCTVGKDLFVSYSWGNQLGNEFLALGVVRGFDERAFCESFFDK